MDYTNNVDSPQDQSPASSIQDDQSPASSIQDDELTAQDQSPAPPAPFALGVPPVPEQLVAPPPPPVPAL